MCAKFAYLLLAAFFVFVVTTVAAFVYLDWWQALLVSLGTFLLLVFVAKQVVRSAFRNLRGLAEGVFTHKSRGLRGATVEVHSVCPTPMPAEVREQLRQAAAEDDAETPDYDGFQWCEVELTLFPPAAAGAPFASWDVGSLRLVPLDAPKLEFLAEDEGDHAEYELWSVRVVQGGEALEPESDLQSGPRRLRFVVGVPRGVRLLKLQYFFEQFGRLELPPALGLPPANPR